MDTYEIIDMERKSSMAERLGNVIHWTAGGIAWLWIAGFGVFILWNYQSHKWEEALGLSLFVFASSTLIFVIGAAFLYILAGRTPDFKNVLARTMQSLLTAVCIYYAIQWGGTFNQYAINHQPLPSFCREMRGI